jgi:hypothetical protein
LKKTIYNTLQFFLFLGIGLAILFLVFHYQNVAFLKDCAQRNIPESECSLTDKLVDDFQGANFLWIQLVLLAFLVSNLSRTIKWNMLLKPLGYQPRPINSFLAILVGYFANLGLPRMGEVIRAGVLSKYEHIATEKVLGTIVVDRVIDVLCLAFALSLALFFEYNKILTYLNSLPQVANANTSSNLLVWIIGLGVIATAVLAYFFRKRILQTAIFQRIIKILRGLWEGILTIRHLEKPWLFIFHSLNIWFLYFLMTWLGFKAFGPTSHLGLEAALTVFVFGSLGIVIPSPGGMGTFHALVIIALTMFYGIKGDDAFSVANIIFFSVSIGFNILLGLLSLVLLPVINRRN